MKLIIGDSGAGKTNFLISKIANNSREDKSNFMYIIKPKQVQNNISVGTRNEKIEPMLYIVYLLIEKGMISEKKFNSVVKEYFSLDIKQFKSKEYKNNPNEEILKIYSEASKPPHLDEEELPIDDVPNEDYSEFDILMKGVEYSCTIHWVLYYFFEYIEFGEKLTQFQKVKNYVKMRNKGKKKIELEKGNIKCNESDGFIAFLNVAMIFLLKEILCMNDCDKFELYLDEVDSSFDKKQLLMFYELLGSDNNKRDVFCVTHRGELMQLYLVLKIECLMMIKEGRLIRCSVEIRNYIDDMEMFSKSMVGEKNLMIAIYKVLAKYDHTDEEQKGELSTLRGLLNRENKNNIYIKTRLEMLDGVLLR